MTTQEFLFIAGKGFCLGVFMGFLRYAYVSTFHSVYKFARLAMRD